MVLGHGALAASFAFFSSSSHAASAMTSGTASAAATKRPRGPADIDVLSVVWSGCRLHTQGRRYRSGDPVDRQMHTRVRAEVPRQMRRAPKQLGLDVRQTALEEQRHSQ